jgi:nicotinamide mononucleotide (NMN) deamidase PncC/nicotinic acid mononucleotide adenylyltransferase
VAHSEPNAVASREFVSRVHAAGTRFVLVTTGGGSQAIPALLTVPGASRTVLEAAVPYSASALTDWLKTQPEHFCSEYTARLMAMAAYQRATAYTPRESAGGKVAGVACTASLASDRPKLGAHRIHVAAQTAELTAVASLELLKGARDRGGEELLAAQLLLNMVARACGLSDRASLDLQASEHVVEEETMAPLSWRQLFAGERNVVQADESPTATNVQMATSSARSSCTKGRAIFPGAFHPLHDGHRHMARIAAEELQTPIEWELSITNVDKPPLDFHEMRLRSAQLSADASLWLTRAPTFVEKARLFPNSTFIVGVDTITRIAEPRYYHGDADECTAAITAIATAGCRFLVFGRKTSEGFETLTDLSLPSGLREICDQIPESVFREDISSTELRRMADS